MKVLVIGSGGREHALAWKIAQSQRVKKLFAAPGNAGIADWPSASDFSRGYSGIAGFRRRQKIDLTVLGRRAAVRGHVDLLGRRAENFRGDAPGRRNRVEQSFATELMTNTDSHARGAASGAMSRPVATAPGGRAVVVKADGLAAGRRHVCASEQEAQEALERLMVQREFGDAGSQVLSRSASKGEEASFWASPTARPVLDAFLPGSQGDFDDDRVPIPEGWALTRRPRSTAYP